MVPFCFREAKLMQPMGNMVKSGQQMNERGEYADFLGGPGSLMKVGYLNL